MPSLLACTRFMTAPFHTRLLRCDSASIVFTSASDLPQISSPDTLAALDIASHHLRDLQTVVFPTETVYGLGASALDASAASKIFSTKGRPADNPLIVHVSSYSMLQTLLPSDYKISNAYQALVKHFWPGALTLLFPRNPHVIPNIISAHHPTVAIRMPSHPVARALIAIANLPLAAPSANTSGKPSPTRAEHVTRDLDGKISIVLDGGACGVGLESTVVDGLNQDGMIRVLRPGGITVEDIERVLKEELHAGEVPRVLVHRRDFEYAVIESAPTTPGMKYRHYSPSVPVVLLCTISPPHKHERSISIEIYLESLKREKLDAKIGFMAPSDSPLWHHIEYVKGIEWCRYPLGPISDPSVTAHRLFDGLLTLEKEGVDLILVEEVKAEREGLAVMNRLRKAAGRLQWITYD